MNLSQFGRLMAQDSPIVQLMEDLGQALNVNPDILFLGGGNPAHVPAAQACLQGHLQQLAQDDARMRSMLGVYQSPQGNEGVLRDLAAYFRNDCRWPVTERNIALVNGSQTAFFILLNLFAGPTPAGPQRHILLPLVPEYLGYGSQGLTSGMFRAQRPDILRTAEHRFKYAIDFDQLMLTDATGALCVSRPTNPSGNLLTDVEMRRLATLAEDSHIPLIVDLAYGKPFPGVVYRDCECAWQSNMINVMSLSKLGLPGVRTGVIVADEEVIQLVVRANTILSLACGNLGPFLLDKLLASGDLRYLSNQVLPAFYRARRDCLVALLDHHLRGLPYRIHEPEGAFFIWLWLEDLPITSGELYQRMKQQDLLVMSGEHFFFGLQESWRHGHECLRLTYCQNESVLAEAVIKLASEVRRLYAQGDSAAPQ